MPDKKRITYICVIVLNITTLSIHIQYIHYDYYLPIHFKHLRSAVMKFKLKKRFFFYRRKKKLYSFGKDSLFVTIRAGRHEPVVIRIFVRVWLMMGSRNSEMGIRWSYFRKQTITKKKEKSRAKVKKWNRKVFQSYI